MADLKPCPFCGGHAYLERTGTRRQSCIVACSDCGARHESSDEDENSGESWNRRVPARGVPASEYLAKIEADPRRAAALQRARDRAADGVATDQPTMDDDVARLMAMSEGEIDAELRRLGIDPAEAERKGKAAVEGALAAIRNRNAGVRGTEGGKAK